MPPTDETPAIPSSGSLASQTAEQVLRFCERVHFSGRLEYESGSVRGALPMLNGTPEIPADDAALERALDEFLALQQGKYQLLQQLPPLEGATSEGDLALEGSLDSTPVASLLRYCEAAGLTGTLTLHHEDRACVARYEHGELLSLTVDDEADAELQNLFAWSTGGFAIRARSVFEKARDDAEPDDKKLLKTLQFALTQILEKSEQARPAATSIAPPSLLRGATVPFGVEGAPAEIPTADGTQRRAALRPRSIPPPGNADSTVKVFFVEREEASGDRATQHAAAKLGAETIALESEPSLPNAVATGDADNDETKPAGTADVEAARVNVQRRGSVGGSAAYSLPLTASFAAVLALCSVVALYSLVVLVR